MSSPAHRISFLSSPCVVCCHASCLVYTTMGISKGVVELQLAAEDPDLCRDKAVELLKEGEYTQSAEW